MSEINLTNQNNRTKLLCDASGNFRLTHNNRNLLAFDRNGNLTASKLMDIIIIQQRQIDTLNAYVNNMRRFMRNFREAIYIDDGSNKEINYTGLI